MRRSRESQEVRREQILEAAFEVATRDRLDGLTVRSVARAAGLSTGLVFFYFKTKEALLVELLDWLLETTIIVKTGGKVLSLPTARERFLARLREAVASVVRERRQVELFFYYWVMGTRDTQVREKIRMALDRYRNVFRPLAEEILLEEPELAESATAEGMACLAVGIVEGCAVQASMDPNNFDVERFMGAIESLVLPALARA